MLNTLLKPVKELFALFRKQNNIVKFLCIIGVIIIGQYITSQLRWGIFSRTYTEEFSGKKGSEMVFCHMIGCRHCKDMMPEWEKFAQENKIKTRKIEVNKNPDFMNKHGVTSFPTVLLLDSNENKVDEYKGKRDASSLAEYAAKVKA